MPTSTATAIAQMAAASGQGRLTAAASVAVAGRIGGGLSAANIQQMDRAEIERLAEARGIDASEIGPMLADVELAELHIQPREAASLSADGPISRVLGWVGFPSTGSPGLDFFAAGLAALGGLVFYRRWPGDRTR